MSTVWTEARQFARKKGAECVVMQFWIKITHQKIYLFCFYIFITLTKKANKLLLMWSSVSHHLRWWEYSPDPTEATLLPIYPPRGCRRTCMFLRKVIVVTLILHTPWVCLLEFIFWQLAGSAGIIRRWGQSGRQTVSHLWMSRRDLCSLAHNGNLITDNQLCSAHHIAQARFFSDIAGGFWVGGQVQWQLWAVCPPSSKVEMTKCLCNSFSSRI